MRFLSGAVAVAVATFVVAGTAHADGGPAPGFLDGGRGVETADGARRYVTLTSGGRTVVAELRSGGVVRHATIHGTWGVPMVAFDGTTAGLIRHGRMLVLAGTIGVPRSTFALVGTHRLRLRETIALRGAFSFDAASPDGRTLFLIQHLGLAADRYRVRAYDVAQRRLVRRVVSDPREKTATMHGYPVTRATSSDGRWVYTLYHAQGDRHTFVHALDTVRRDARCIDLPAASSDSVWAFGLDLRGDELAVVDEYGDLHARIDTRTFEAHAADGGLFAHDAIHLAAGLLQHPQ
ncbi:MAG: hypothetical protein M3188_08975 [Actinomycetota bacterium]|nr:hypothetical protein [Actinomycetota bacterium]